MSFAVASSFNIDQLVDDHLPAARRGDEQAYARIVAACQNSVTTIALAIVRDVAISEDIAQEAFLKAWQGLDTLKNHASFLPWLRQITRNLARDYLRSNRARPLTGEGAEMAINMAADPSPSPAEQLLQTEQEQAAADIISSLPEDSRETLLLYYREGQRSRQVAALLGLSDAAVRKRLSRAREQVRSEMLARFGEFARSTAPGTAFTAVVVGSLAMASPTLSAAAVIGSGVLGSGLGKIGTGTMVGTGVSSGVAGSSLSVVLGSALGDPSVVNPLLGGLVGGMAGFGFTYWYLMRFAITERDRRGIGRFMLQATVIGAVLAMTLMLVSLRFPNSPLLLAAAALGLSVMNYQWLVPMPRLMQPMLDHPSNRHRLRLYALLMGRKAVVWSTVLALLIMALVVFDANGAVL